jgi:hypothetical protein
MDWSLWIRVHPGVACHGLLLLLPFEKNLEQGGYKGKTMMHKWPTIEMCLRPSCITPLLVGNKHALAFEILNTQHYVTKSQSALNL